MALFGKIFGGVFGSLIYGPLGFIIGVGVGHLFDKGIELNAKLNDPDVAVSKKVFFKSTFMIMGYIAKLDGRVSEREIKVAREAMNHLQLTSEQKVTAIEYFNMGKSPQFHFETTADNFVKYCGHHPQLVQLFVEIQVQCALVDGIRAASKRHALERLCDKLNLSYSILNQMENQYGYHHYTPPPKQPERKPQDELASAYELLGVSQTAPFNQVKKAYRQLMSQHHPDKLVSKGLPKEMIKIATEKTQRIQKAFELVARSRGEK